MEEKYQQEDSKLFCSNSNDIFTVYNGKLENPVALLTFDEVALAGGSSNTYGNNYYLNNNCFTPYALLSPGRLISDSVMIGVKSHYNDLGLQNPLYPVDARPSLSLKNDVAIIKGNGTTVNPYILKIN